MSIAYGEPTIKNKVTENQNINSHQGLNIIIIVIEENQKHSTKDR